MSTVRMAFRTLRPSMAFSRPLSTTTRRFANPGNSKPHAPVEDYRKTMIEKELNPHMTNTNSAVVNEVPSAGAKNVPPEFISSVDPKFEPEDSEPENTERMTGGTQKGAGEGKEDGEIGVGEMEGGKFKIEPLHRSGEDPNTMRARLLYQSRKRGTLESDLLMSTFADSHLINMTPSQMAQYDKFLDENDWDIYYWATQTPSPTSQVTAEGAAAGPEGATGPAVGKDKGASPVAKGSGEWAQTVGTFKPAYRPVPARWKNSEILAMLRRHVISRSAGGVLEVDSKSGEDVEVTGGGGMAFMPPVFQTDRPDHK